MKNMFINKYLINILAILSVVVSTAGSTVYAQSAAMVTDVAGGVTVQSGPTKGAITMLSEIGAGTRLQLAGSAQLVVLYLGSGDEYTMSGPAVIEFRATDPVAVSGAAPVKRANPLAKGNAAVRIKPVGVAQGAIVMRSARPADRMRLLNLSATRILETAPEFRWQALEPGVKYQFELIDDTGRTLHEAQSDAASYRLPAGMVLKEGITYTWEVSARLGDGRKFNSSGDFTVAPAALRKEAEALRPAQSDPISTRVAYAAWLDQMELKDEAKKYWRAIAAERPEDTRLKTLAAE
jgi:hypothetical protein